MDQRKNNGKRGSSNQGSGDRCRDENGRFESCDNNSSQNS